MRLLTSEDGDFLKYFDKIDETQDPKKNEKKFFVNLQDKREKHESKYFNKANLVELHILKNFLGWRQYKMVFYIIYPN